MNKALLLIFFALVTNILFAQLPKECEKYLQKLVQSSPHYKKRFGAKNVFKDKKWAIDASSDGSNLVLTIYHENNAVGAYNRIAAYTLNGTTNKLSVEDTYSKNNSSDIFYNKKSLIDVYKYCKKK